MRAHVRAGMTAAILAALFAMPARGLGERWRYGGSGADELREIAGVPGGYFAVGTTASTDGDLSSRTRQTQAGWAMYIREDGAPMWSFCSGRSGMTAMRAPVAVDGGFSFVLADDAGQRGEWIVLDERGRMVSRTAFDAADILPGMRIEAMTPVNAPDGLRLVLMLADEGGAVTPVMVSGDGSASAGEKIDGAQNGRLAANGRGECAWATARGGRLNIVRLTGGAGVQSAGDGMGIAQVCDALMQEDGSVTAAVGTTDGGALVRMNAAGGVIFAYHMEEMPAHICQTETGFAAYAGDGSAVFLDEDGGLLGEADGLPRNALDVVGVPGGAALLLHEGARSAQEAVLLTVEPQAVAADATPEPQGEPAHETARREAGDGIVSGSVKCESVPGGVRVTCMDEAGRRVFETRIPIHTAADALVWQCALPMDDGGLALGGCYVYGTGEGARCTGAVALLDGAGVLRRIDEIPEIGCVLGIAAGGVGRLVLDAATDGRVGAQADTQMDFML